MATSIPVIASKGNLGFFFLQSFQYVLETEIISKHIIFFIHKYILDILTFGLKVLSWKYRQQLLLHIVRLGSLRTYQFTIITILGKKSGEKTEKASNILLNSAID